MEMIAKQFGFSDYNTIYNDPNNAAFKVLRPNPHILYPGDKVFIPDKNPGDDPAVTDKKHKYVIQDPKITLTLYIRRNGEPFKNQRYTLKIGAKSFAGTTGADGLIFQKDIPLGVALGVLKFSSLPSYTRNLNLGFLHPITKSSGVQMRLNNLGFGCGAPTGAESYAYTSALQAFQRTFLPQNVTGAANSDTIDALRTEYDKGVKS